MAVVQMCACPLLFVARMEAAVAAATARTGGSPFWNGGRSETRMYVWGGPYIDDLVAYQRTNDQGTQTYYAHSGAQYSVQAVTDASGNLVEQYSYDAYGTRTVVGSGDGRSTIGLTSGLTGRAVDEESGLMYFRNRMYSPGKGTFVSRDPMGYVDGMSLYRAYYVPDGADPLGELDIASSGMWPSLLPYKHETDYIPTDIFEAGANPFKIGSSQTITNAVLTLSLWSYLESQAKGATIAQRLTDAHQCHHRVVAHSQGVRNAVEGLYKYSKENCNCECTSELVTVLLVAPRTTPEYLRGAFSSILNNCPHISLNVMILYSSRDHLDPFDGQATNVPRNGGVLGGYSPIFDGDYYSGWQLQVNGPPPLTRGGRGATAANNAAWDRTVAEHLQHDFQETHGQTRLHVESHDTLTTHDYLEHLNAFPQARAFISGAPHD